MAYCNVCFERQRAFEYPGSQRLAFQEFHDEIIYAAVMANIMERANMGMIEARNHSGLALKTIAEFGAVGQVRRKNLDGKQAIQPRVASPPCIFAIASG